MSNGTDSTKAIIRAYDLPNGTVVNWDGALNSSESLGKATQEIHCSSNGMTLFNKLLAKQDNYGILTLTRLNSNPATIVTLTCNATLEYVENITSRQIHDTASMDIKVTFQLWSTWA